MNEKRQLQAIMFTDVVGYTKLMGNNETKALALLQKQRQLLKGLLKNYRGRLVKELGDGTLCVFSSAMDAASCALAMQIAAKRATIPLRIGIHLGEIVERDHDVFGDGVNIASRIEALAPTQGVVISDLMRQALKNQAQLTITAFGEHQLKNVDEPTRVFLLEGEPAEERKPILSRWSLTHRAGVIVASALIALTLAWVVLLPRTVQITPLPNDGFIRLAVLPFENVSRDPAQEYFSDGLSEEMIHTLSMIDGLRVSARASSFQFKSRISNLQDVARQLEVEYLLTGSVRRAGEQLRVSAELLRPANQDVLWTQVYNRQLTASVIFEVQEDIARAVANEIPQALPLPADLRLAQFGSSNLDAYDAYLHAQQLVSLGDANSRLSALVYYERALAADPNFIHALIGRAENLLLLYFYGAMPDSSVRNEARQTLMSIEARAERLAVYQSARGLLAFVERDFDSAERFYLRALEEDPSNFRTLLRISVLFELLGRFDEQLAMQARAVELDPLNPVARSNFIQGLMTEGHGERAEQQCQRLVESSRYEFSSNYCQALIAGQWHDDAVLSMQYYYQSLQASPYHLLSMAEGVLLWLEAGAYTIAETWIAHIHEPARRAVLLGSLAYMRGDFEAAEQIFVEAFNDGRGDFWMRTIMAELLVAQGRYDEVDDVLRPFEQLFDEPIVIPPPYYRAAIARFAAATARHDNELSMSLNEALIAYEHNRPSRGHYAVRYGKAERLAILGESEKAFAELERLKDSAVRPIGRPGALLSYQKPYWHALQDRAEFIAWREAHQQEQQRMQRAMQDFKQFPK